jgi:hypothetical protein
MNDIPAPSPALAAPAAPAGGIDLNPIIDGVIKEIRELEAEVNEKTTALQIAREKLAAARGKMDMIGQIQQASMGNGQAQP